MKTLIPASPDFPARQAEPTCPASKPVAPPRHPEGREPGATAALAEDYVGEVAPRYRATGGISPKERQHLARLARQAWEKCGARGAGIDFDEWRHEQVAEATDGKASGLTELRRGQYRDALRHFLALAGESARAFRVATRGGQRAADRDLALAKLREACEAGGLAYPEYPESICRRQFGVELERLETGKVWFLFYTCTQRGRAKAKHRAENAPDAPDAATAIDTLPERCDAGNPVGGPGESYATETIRKD
jgi:hypothetical protein